MSLPKTMRAAICPTPGQMELREVEVPRPLREGEVLVRVRRCGICGSDLHWYKGHVPPPGLCPGHEVTAVVAATGPGTHRLREGDRVAVEGIRSCGACHCCTSGNPQLCPQLSLIGLSTPGGFADYLVTDGRHLYPVPDQVDDETAQLTEPLAVDVHALRLADFQPGQRVLILGGGTIGLLAVSAAAAAGAGEITLSARRPQQQSAARALGAHRILDAGVDGSGPAADPGGGYDVVLDTVADPSGSLDQAVGAIRSGGTIVLVGVFLERPGFDALSLMMREIRLVGSMCYGRARGEADFEAALDILSRRGADIRDHLVTHRLPLDEIDEGFRIAADKTSGSIKVSIGISSP